MIEAEVIGGSTEVGEPSESFLGNKRVWCNPIFIDRIYEGALMRRWLKWPLLLMVGALWGIAAYKLADLNFYCGLRGVTLWLLFALFVFPYAWVPYLLGWQLQCTLIEYFDAVYAAPFGIVNVLIIYLVVVGVRRVLARRRSRREPGA